MTTPDNDLLWLFARLVWDLVEVIANFYSTVATIAFTLWLINHWTERRK